MTIVAKSLSWRRYLWCDWWREDVSLQMHHPVLTKNTPENNRLLAEVKHLVHIQPLRLPHGLPSHPSDYEHTMVTSDGRLVVKRRLAQHEPAADSEDDRATWRLQPDTVKARLDRGRVTHMVHTDEHKTQYVYKRNQDGKEYRYNFNKPSTDWYTQNTTRFCLTTRGSRNNT